MNRAVVMVCVFAAGWAAARAQRGAPRTLDMRLDGPDGLAHHIEVLVDGKIAAHKVAVERTTRTLTRSYARGPGCL